MRLTSRPYRELEVRDLALLITTTWGTKIHGAPRASLDKMHQMKKIDDMVVGELGRDIVTEFLTLSTELEHPILPAIKDELQQRLDAP